MVHWHYHYALSCIITSVAWAMEKIVRKKTCAVVVRGAITGQSNP